MRTMPFGKHKGQDLKIIPRGYLRWVAKNCDVSGDLKNAIDAAIARQDLPITPADEKAVLYERLEAMFGGPVVGSD